MGRNLALIGPVALRAKFPKVVRKVAGVTDRENVADSLTAQTTRAEFGNLLTALRVSSGRTVRDLAAQVQTSPSTVAGWLRAERLPSESRQPLFADLLRALGIEDTDPWLDALSRLRDERRRRNSRLPTAERSFIDASHRQSRTVVRHSNQGSLTVRHPDSSDALAIWQLVQSTPALDSNSAYLYIILSEFFSKTCLIAKLKGELAGMVTGFTPPAEPRTLFVWQIAVSAEHRGSGLAPTMLERLILSQPHPIRFVKATIAPENFASKRVFEKVANRVAAPMVFTPFLKGEDLAAPGTQHPDEHLAVIGPIRAAR